MIKLYRFLGGLPGLKQTLRKRPLIRLENGSHVAAFDANDAPQAWLPSAGNGEYPSVRRRLSEDEGARRWLEFIGLTEPDIVDLVVGKLLSKYSTSHVVELRNQAYEQDLARIVAALKQANGEKATRLRESLAATPFLVGRNAASGERSYQCPGSLFAPTPQLRLLFEGNPEIYFLDEGLSGNAGTWHEVGVRLEPVVRYRGQRWSSSCIVLRKSHGDHARGRNGFDPDFDVPGLAYSLQHPSLERSLAIWDLLLPYRATIRGVIETSKHQTYDRISEETRQSKLGEVLTAVSWLPDRQGLLRHPADLMLEELHEGFTRDDILAAALLMKPTLSVPPAVKAALGIGDEEIAYLMKNKERFLELIQELRKRERVVWGEAGGPGRPATQEGGGPDSLEASGLDQTSGLSYRALVAEAFARPASGSPPSTPLGPTPAYDPERRQMKAEREISEGQRSEPGAETRFAKVPRRVWENKNGVVRTFLLEEYQGRCQVCGQTFVMRNGQPYFEGLYLVPHVVARWIDRPGDVLCLCATCSAKFQHGAVELDAFDERVLELAPVPTGEGHLIALGFRLCGEERQLHFSQKHLIDLQALVQS